MLCPSWLWTTTPDATHRSEPVAHEPIERPRVDADPPTRGRFVLLTRTKAPRSAGTSSITLGNQRFRAGATVTELGSAAVCPGTYHGAVIAQPLVGSPITVGRFSFKAPPRR